MTSLIENYRRTLKQTIRGIKLRAFFTGYNSRLTQRYIQKQKGEIYHYENELGEEFLKSENLRLRSKLFGLEVRAMLD